MPWVRPASVPVGQVWLRFDGREKNGVCQKYQIRDMEEKYREQCLDLMMVTFLRDEPLCQVLDIKSDPESGAQIRKNWQQFLDQRVSLACFTEENGTPVELVGFNFLYVTCRGEKEDDVYGTKGEKWNQLLSTLSAVEALVDVFQYYNVETCLSGSGMTVLPEHRGQNIGARLIQAREPLCKALNIEATCTVYTASASQALALKCGHEPLAELRYEQMLGRGIDLTRCSTKVAMLIGKKIA